MVKNNMNLFSGIINSVVQGLWNIVYCNFITSSETKTDRRTLIIPEDSLSKTSMGSVNLINVPTPPCIDLTLITE